MKTERTRQGDGPRRGRPRASSSEDTRAAILRAGRHAFADSGYEATSVKQIAEAAGLTHNALYHYFPSKEALFRAVMQDADGLLLDVYRGAVAGVSGFTARMAALVDATQALHAADPSLAAFLSLAQVESHRLRGPAPASPATSPEAGDVIRFLAGLVDDAWRAGELAPDVDPAGVVAMILAGTLGLALYATLIDPVAQEPMFGAWRALVTGTLVTAPVQAPGHARAP